jgi:hypothetical protein
VSDATCNLNGGFKRTTKRSADLTGPDFFPTPKWATFALIENDTFNGDFWESAVYAGALASVRSFLALQCSQNAWRCGIALGSPPNVRPVGSIGYQTARFDVFSNEAKCW